MRRRLAALAVLSALARTRTRDNPPLTRRFCQRRVVEGFNPGPGVRVHDSFFGFTAEPFSVQRLYRLIPANYSPAWLRIEVASAAGMSAIADHAVAAIEIHWS